MSTGDEGDEAYDPYDDAPEWTDEDEERYQTRQEEELGRRRRRRRQGWSFFVLVLVVLAAGVGGAGINQGWWAWPFGDEAEAEGPDCTREEPSISAPGQVRVNVLNATEVRGLAAAVSDELGVRGYTVADIGNAEGAGEVTAGAEIRYGPGLAADAQSVALQLNGAILVDDGRQGDVVDVVLGAAFRTMAPAEEAAAAIAAATPVPPAGCEPSSAPSTTGATPGATG